MQRRGWLLGMAGLLASPAWAERVLRLLVAYPPGGVSDDAARQIAPALGTSVVTEHRPGAGGRIALEALAQSAPDGLTLCYSAIAPLTLPSRRPVPRVQPVVAVLQTPALLVATPAFTGARLEDVIAQARAAPGRLRWATSGVGTTGHLVLAQVAATAGVSITHVPYKGGGHQINDALAGQFELLLTNAGPLQRAHVAAARLRALALGNPVRLAGLPDVPTFAEAGFPEANLGSVFGLFAPAGTPPGPLNAVNTAVNGALAHAAFREHFEAAGSVPLGGTVEAFERRIRMEAARWRHSRVARELVG